MTIGVFVAYVENTMLDRRFERWVTDNDDAGLIVGFMLASSVVIDEDTLIERARIFGLQLTPEELKRELGRPLVTHYADGFGIDNVELRRRMRFHVRRQFGDAKCDKFLEAQYELEARRKRKDDFYAQARMDYYRNDFTISDRAVVDRPSHDKNWLAALKQK